MLLRFIPALNPPKEKSGVQKKEKARTSTEIWRTLGKLSGQTTKEALRLAGKGTRQIGYIRRNKDEGKAWPR